MIAPVVAGLASLPIYWRFITDPGARLFWINDYQLHLLAVREWGWFPLRITAPHFAFHAPAAIAAAVVGPRWGPALLLASVSAATAGMIVWLARRPMGSLPGLGRGAAVAAGLFVFVFDSPLALANAVGLEPRLPFAQMHVWSNPTDNGALLGALVLLVLLAWVVDSPAGAWWAPNRQHALLLVGTVLATLAKPTVTLALLPAVPIVLLAKRRWTTRSVASICAWSCVPAAAVMCWQIWFLHNFPEAHQYGFDTYGVHLDPFYALPVLGRGPGGPVLFWSTFGWVLLAAWVGRGRFWRQTPVLLAATSIVVSLPAALFVREDAPFENSGNFLKPLMYGYILLVVLAVLHLAREAAAVLRRRPGAALRPRWLLVAAVMCVAWSAGGVAVYLDASGAGTAGSSFPTTCTACQQRPRQT